MGLSIIARELNEFFEISMYMNVEAVGTDNWTKTRAAC